MKAKTLILLISIFFYNTGINCQNSHSNWHRKDTMTTRIEADTTKDQDLFESIGFQLNGFSFSTELENFYPDTANNGIIFIFKSKNRYKVYEIIYYDLLNSKVVWSHFTSQKNVRIFDRYLTASIYYTEDDSHKKSLLSLDTGAIIKTLDDHTELVKLDSSDTYLSFPIHQSKKSISFLNSNTFEEIGEQRIKKVYYLNALKETKSNLKINVNGIFSFDSTFKLKWFYPVNNRHESLSSVLEYFYIPYFRHLNTLIDMPVGFVPNYDIFIGSEFVEIDSSILVSGIEFIDKINDRSGERIWQNTFPKKQGYSRIHIKNDTVIILGMALSVRDGLLYFFKKPSLTILDYNTGEILKFINFKDSRYMIDYEITGNEITILLNNKMVQYNITNPDIEKPIFDEGEEKGDYQFFIKPTDSLLYYMQDSSVIAVNDLIGETPATLKNKKLLYFKNGITQSLPSESIYYELYSADYKYIFNDGGRKLTIAQLDGQNNMVNHFFFETSHFKLIGSNLLLLWKNKFTVLKLK